MLLLLVEDDLKISKLLLNLLRQEGHQVDHAVNGEEALMYIDLNDYQVVILDWMMPILNGIDTCNNLRKKGYNGGILMLTAKDTLDDKVIGLEAGADDYLIKPFEFRELSARLKALSRRSVKIIQKKRIYKGEYSIDRQMQAAFYKDSQMDLSRREYQLFSLLFENNGLAIPRNTIIDLVWGVDGEISENNLDAFIRLLRKKIAHFDNRKVLFNVRGIGYKLEV